MMRRITKTCLFAVLAVGLMASTSLAEITWTTGAPGGFTPGGALDFNNDDGVVNVPGFDMNPLIQSSDYTMSLWLNFDAVQNDRFFLGQTNQGIHLGVRNGDKLHQAHWGADHSGTTALTAGTWVNALFTYDNAAGLGQIYFDGVADGPLEPKNAPNGGGNLILGARNNGDNQFDGLMDEVAIWNSVLTGAQITDLAGGANPLAVGPAPLLYYNFEEGAGSVVGDSSANGFDGSLPIPEFLPPSPTPRGTPVFYDNMILFEMRTKAGGNQGQAEIYRLNDDDLDNDGVPDDPNVLLQTGMHVLNTANVDAGNTYGLGWTTGNPTTGTMVNLEGDCCAGDNQQNDLIMVNEFQLYDNDGVFEFSENFDDGIRISVNGTLIHADRGWNVRTNAVWNDEDGQGGGWYDIVVHASEDGGGAASAGGNAFEFANNLGGPFAVLIDGYVGDADANGVSYRVALNTLIPEPGTLTLALIGLLGLCGVRRRRARS